MDGLASLLDEQQKKLRERQANLEKQTPLDEKAMQMLEVDKQKNARARLELKNAVDRVMILDTQQKIEKAEFLMQCTELQNKIEAKHALEWDIQRLGGQMQVLKRTRLDTNDEEEELQEVDPMKKKLQEAE